MRRSLITGIVLVGMLAVFAGGNSGQTSTKAWQSNAVKAILAANAGHRPIGRLPSGAFQEAVESGLLKTHIPAGAKPPSFPPTQNSDGCSNT